MTASACIATVNLRIATFRLRRAIVGALCATQFVAVQTYAQSLQAHPDQLNNGEDFTRPVWRLEVREQYETLSDSHGLSPDKWVTTLRGDGWSGLDQGWKLYGRVDVPLVRSNDVTSSFNPDGEVTFGLGDLLTEFAVITPATFQRWGFGAGLRAVWPTASLNEAGKGKLQLGPLIGLRADLPEITRGSFLLTQVRYLNSIASRNENKGRGNINQLDIQPKFNIGLPDAWFVAAYAVESIQISFADDNKLFLPMDLMVGKKIAGNWVVSLDYSRELLHGKDYEPYEWQLEGRIAYTW
jgi:hypothetical protein